ncbi:hypothetical protein [Aeromonas caviae]|uniref:hypothetical protein n=1 Tax=Aeromonas caviae TaxID=648 RepID=UPI0029D7A20B|nr:hypothetical protein [Aeromonas caviae]MDX7787416.1 hypothetical protein [Aeromonas caviae]
MSNETQEINWTEKKEEAIRKLDKDLITQLNKPEAKATTDKTAEEVQIAGYLALADKVTAAANDLREAVKHEKTYLIKKQIAALGLTAADLGLADTKSTTRGSKSSATKEAAAKVKIWYMNEHSQPDTVEIGLKGPAPADNASLKAFLSYAKDTKSKTRKDLDVTKISIEEFRDTFQGYKYTAA